MLPRIYAKDQHFIEKTGRNAGRLVVIERYGARGDEHIYYIRSVSHPRNAKAVGRGAWVSESTLTNKFERTTDRE